VAGGGRGDAAANPRTHVFANVLNLKCRSNPSPVGVSDQRRLPEETSARRRGSRLSESAPAENFGRMADEDDMNREKEAWPMEVSFKIRRVEV
jgi:hypothetical protein